jgi:hypothetical protein
MNENSLLADSALRLLEEGHNVVAVLSLFEKHGGNSAISMIQALRQVVPVGLSEAAAIVDSYRNNDPRIAQLDHARLLLLAHPGVREGWNGDGQQMYRFFRSAVMDGYDALTIVPMGKNQYGNSFHFWWRPEAGGSEEDPLFGSISGSEATIESLGKALRCIVAHDSVFARHVEIVCIAADRICCRFHLNVLEVASSTRR